MLTTLMSWKFFACSCSILVVAHLTGMDAQQNVCNELEADQITAASCPNKHPATQYLDNNSDMTLLPTDQGREFSQRSEPTMAKVNHVMSHMLERLNKSSRLDKSGDYVIVDNLLTPYNRSLREESITDVTLATQCTSNLLHPYLVLHSERWRGPVSVAVFTYKDDFLHALTVIAYLHLCFASVARHVSFHLSFPMDHFPKDSDLFRGHNGNFSCSSLSKGGGKAPSKNFAFDGMDYPINMLRNVALRQVNTSHVFVLDVDLVLSDNLRGDFIEHVVMSTDDEQEEELRVRGISSDKLAYVVPAFEFIRQGEAAPSTKAALLEAWRRFEVRQFHLETSPHCHQPSNYYRWRKLPQTDLMRAAYFVRYKPNYEPYYIAPSPLPLYDERFRNFGRDRQSQVCEMHFADYHFTVLNNAFVVHDGFKDMTTLHDTWFQELQKNTLRFRWIQQDLETQYNPEEPKDCEKYL